MNSFTALLLVAAHMFSQAPDHDWSVVVKMRANGAECHAYHVSVDPWVTGLPEDEQAVVIGHEMTHCLQNTEIAFGTFFPPCSAEIDADAGGIKLATLAGYDGRAAMARVLIKMGATSGCALKRLNQAKEEPRP